MNWVTVTVPGDEALKAHLLAPGVNGPTLHPRANTDELRDRWNGWNRAVALGLGADGLPVTAEVWEFASGHRDFEANGRLSGNALRDLAYPLEMLPAVPMIAHPEHTPACRLPIGMMVEPTEEMKGRVARVRLNDEREYVAEVRTDFGRPAWAGSWHGFTLDKGKAIEVLSWLSESGPASREGE